MPFSYRYATAHNIFHGFAAAACFRCRHAIISPYFLMPRLATLLLMPPRPRQHTFSACRAATWRFRYAADAAAALMLHFFRYSADLMVILHESFSTLLAATPVTLITRHTLRFVFAAYYADS